MKYLTLIFFILIFAFTVSAQTNAVIITDSAILRGTPSEQGKSIQVVRNNDQIEVLAQRGAWFLVQTTDLVGWLHGNNIRLNSALTTVNTTKTPRTVRQTTTRQKPSVNKNYIRGPRGGCYYINGNGNKTYVSRSLCN